MNQTPYSSQSPHNSGLLTTPTNDSGLFSSSSIIQPSTLAQSQSNVEVHNNIQLNPESTQLMVGIVDDLHVEYKYEDFQLIHELNIVTYGRIFLVKHKKSGQLYTMKRVQYVTLEERRAVDEEINHLRLTQSKYTVKLIGIFMHDVDMCILQEYCSGGNLRQLIEKMKLWTPLERKIESNIYVSAIIWTQLHTFKELSAS
ncbi:MAG: hypothetical protein EZS28_022953 [Streblomastix strix]|uniref:Protein kinase domain-containing protein n=1 Tax=Streblomastix strix TaxID=222440 RepID=A0A5J4VG76_9EUKA|nr:MAG: hypothetical protein EZS28_022953 [Streblomastix strix]